MKIDVLGHSERLDLPILPPVNEPKHMTGSLKSTPIHVASLTCYPALFYPSYFYYFNTLLHISPVSSVGFGNLLPRQSAQLPFRWVLESEQTGANHTHACEYSTGRPCTLTCTTAHTCRCRGASVQTSSVGPSAA